MIYTAGQNVLTRKQLNLIKVPTRDNVSANWKGLNHGVLASTLVKRIEKQGLVIAQPQARHALGCDRHPTRKRVAHARDRAGR